ncbi:MAG TPA: hypothetical protein VIQ31_30605, partial [Phormidium sp.]
MGGLEEGGQCATLAISVFASSLISSQQNDFQKKLIEAVNDANKAVYKQFLGNGGTTLSAIIFDENFNCWGANVGDSRIYTSFPNKRIKQLSFDDTIQAELLNLNRPINNSMPDFRRLFQYVGVGKDLDISSERNVFRIDVKKEFKYLILTSDGIHNIPSETLESLVINAESSYELTYRLITHAEWTGGLDNASIVVIPNQVVSTSHIDDEVVAGGIAFLTLQGWISILPPAIIKNLVDDDETVNRSQFRKSRRGTTKPSPISTSTKSRDVLERKSESTSIVSSYENMPGEPMNPLVGIDSSVSRTSKDERQKLSSEKEAGDSRRQKQDEFSEQSSADGEQSKVAPEPLQLDIGNELNEASQLDNQKAFNSSGKAFPEE